MTRKSYLCDMIRRSCFLIVAIFMMAVAPVQAAEQVHRSSSITKGTMIFFICKTSAAAEVVALNMEDVIPGLTPLPSGCRWLYPVVLPRNIASIEEIIKAIPFDDGRHAVVARVIREKMEHGYSAGFMELLLS